MLSNPVTVFVSGNEQKYFKYEGGEKLWHFSPRQCGLSTTMNTNVVFFADDGKHALDVLTRMFQFMIDGYSVKYKSQNIKMDERRDRNLSYMEKILSNKDKWIITLAPTDQFYKVGWASNDTI